MCYIRKRKKNIKKRAIISLLLIISVILALIVYINGKLDSIVSDIAKEQIKNNISLLVSNIVNSYVYDGEYINVSYDNGSVKSVGANARELNTLKNQTVADISEAISNVDEYDVYVSLSNIFDDEVIFGNSQIRVKANVVPIYSVECSVRSELTDAGINQTHYSIYLSINVNVTAVLLISTVHVQSTYELCVADMIIVGDVPAVYLYEG